MLQLLWLASLEFWAEEGTRHFGQQRGAQTLQGLNRGSVVTCIWFQQINFEPEGACVANQVVEKWWVKNDLVFLLHEHWGRLFAPC